MFKITYEGKGGWEKGRKGLKLTFCDKYGLSKVNETAKNCIFCWQCAAGQSGSTLVDQSGSTQLENIPRSALSCLDRMAKGQDTGSGVLK